MMKKTLLLMLLLLLLLMTPTLVLAQKWNEFYDLLPEKIQEFLIKAYPEWTVPTGAFLYDDSRAALLVLQKNSQNIAVIVEKTGTEYKLTACNDAMLPDGMPINEKWWIQDKWQDGKPYIWYVGSEEAYDGFYYSFEKNVQGIWCIVNGSFGDPGSYGEHTLQFEIADQGATLRICAQSYFSPVYIPLNMDLTFDKFDPQELMAACADAMELKKETGSDTLSQTEADALIKQVE